MVIMTYINVHFTALIGGIVSIKSCPVIFSMSVWSCEAESGDGISPKTENNDTSMYTNNLLTAWFQLVIL